MEARLRKQEELRSSLFAPSFPHWENMGVHRRAHSDVFRFYGADTPVLNKIPTEKTTLSSLTSYRENFIVSNFKNAPFEPKYPVEQAQERYCREIYGNQPVLHRKTQSVKGKRGINCRLFKPALAPRARKCSFADTSVRELKLEGLPLNFTTGDVRELFSGSLILAAQTKLDTITGRCSGTGSVKIQVTEQTNLSVIKANLHSKGIKLT